MTELRLPQITGRTEKEQLEQMKTYMFQLTRELNFALKDVKASETEYRQTSQGGVENISQAATEQDSAIETFSKVKGLIIKSADIVNAYYEVINKKLEGIYVAESDFGTFKEYTEGEFKATSKSISQHYTSIKEIEDAVNNLNELRKDSCYIKTGWLDDDQTIAGVEIGKYSETSQGTDTGFARFTTDELAFYDGQGTKEENKLAWFSKYRSYFRNVKLIGNVEFDNDYILDTSDGLALKWAGDN
jgi:hypothetical protein